jgi:hypothetical protein
LEKCKLDDPLCLFGSEQPRGTTICHHCDSYPCVCGADTTYDKMYEFGEETITVYEDTSMEQFLWACGLNGDKKARKELENHREEQRLREANERRSG